MKILHITSGGDKGGAKTHFFALYRKLVKMADIKVVCLIKGLFYEELNKTAIPHILFEQKNRFDLSVVKQISKLVKDENYQIIHAHGARANFVAMLLKRNTDIPVVTTIHSDYLLDFDILYKKIIFTSMNILSLRKMDYYIAVSENFRKMLINRRFMPNRIYTVYNGMDFSVQRDIAAKQKFAESLGIKYDESLFYVGIAGRMDKVKGTDVFIKASKLAAEKNDRIRFILAGDGPERVTLDSFVTENNLHDKIFFTGHINDIYSFFNLLDVNTCTSYNESFPYVLLEGASMGKCTVCSAVGGIPDLIIDGQTGRLFNSGDHEELARIILELAGDKEQMDLLGKNLQNYAISNFSDEALAKKHIEIYQSIIKKEKENFEYDVAISGYYGFNNVGDDALLMSIKNELKKQKDDIKLAVFSKRPIQSMLVYGIDARKSFNPFSVICTLRKSKMLISGGGSLIQDGTSSRSLYYYLAIIWIAVVLKKRVIIFGSGIGPIRRRLNYRLAGKILKKVDMITLRDNNSLKLIEGMHIDSDKIEVTADPALLLDFAFSEKPKFDGDYILVCVRDWPASGRDFERNVAYAADKIARKYNCKILFMPSHYPFDLAISKRLHNVVEDGEVIKERLLFEEMIGIIKCAKVVLSMRLHPVIFAASFGIPVVGLIYDPKILGFLEDISLSDKLDVSTVNKDEIEKSLDDIFTHYDEYSNKLAIRSAELKLKARRNIYHVIETLEKIN